MTVRGYQMQFSVNDSGVSSGAGVQVVCGVPSILVLLATYNGEKFISQQLESLAAQRGVSIEILVSDDGSTDRTLEIVRRDCSRLGLNWKLLPFDRASGSAARNFFQLLLGAKFSGFDYVAFCDQDDIWLPDKLSSAVRFLTEGNYECYSSNSIAFWPDGREAFVRKDYPARAVDFLFESASHGCTYVFRARTARDFVQFLEELGSGRQHIDFHDWLMYAWARKNFRRWGMDPCAYIKYRQSSGNVIGANVGFKAALARWRLLRSGWLRRQALLIAEAIGLGNDPLVRRLQRLSFADRLILLIRGRQMRRRFRDAAAWSLLLMVGSRLP